MTLQLLTTLVILIIMSVTKNDIPDTYLLEMYLGCLQQHFANELMDWFPNRSYTYYDLNDNKNIVHDTCESIRKILGLPSYVYKSPYCSK